MKLSCKLALNFFIPVVFTNDWYVLQRTVRHSDLHMSDEIRSPQ